MEMRNVTGEYRKNDIVYKVAKNIYLNCVSVLGFFKI